MWSEKFQHFVICLEVCTQKMHFVVVERVQYLIKSIIGYGYRCQFNSEQYPTLVTAQYTIIHATGKI